MVKTCKKCGEYKPLTEFNQNRCTRDGYEYRCKACRNEWYRARHAQNPEHRRRKVRDWYSVNRDKILKRQAADAKRIARRTQWARENAAKCSAKVALRDALKAKATPKWLTLDDLAEIERLYEAARQKTALTGIKHVVDHIYPLRGQTVCGLHVPGNLRVITAAENAAKGNRLIQLLQKT